MYGSGDSPSGSIATVAVVFLFCGVYSIAWTPLATTYPPEILNYTCRASGMAAFSFTAWSSVVFISFVFPFALEGIGWKFYIVNAGWDVFQVSPFDMLTTYGKGSSYLLLLWGDPGKDPRSHRWSVRRCSAHSSHRQCVRAVFTEIGWVGHTLQLGVTIFIGACVMKLSSCKGFDDDLNLKIFNFLIFLNY